MSEIQFYELKCKRCGGQLEQNGAIYKCESCGKTFEKQVVSDVADQLRAVLNEQKQEAVANLRRQLWVEMHEQYINSEKITDLARDIKKYLPEDYFANFCEVANSGNDRQVSQFLNNTPQSAMADYADVVLDFMLKSVTASNLNAISLFIERAFKGDTQNYDKYITGYEQEAQKVNSGIYELIITRDVFLAYSSKDIDKVLELCDYLERNKITCFLALRNLRHGRGAVDNYDQALKTAIDNCRTVVFVSSTNSRDMTCDALIKELPYIKKKDFENAPADCKRNYYKIPSDILMPRVQYLTEDYKNDGSVAEGIVDEFFHDLEWCRSKEEVARRVSDYLTETHETAAQRAERESREFQQQLEQERRKAEEERRKTKELELKIAQAQQSAPAISNVKIEEVITPESFNGKKICKTCKKSNNVTAKFCPDCGNNAFYTTYDEYYASKIKFCSECGTQNNIEDKYCVECGSTKFVPTKKAYEELVIQREEEERQRKIREEKERKEKELKRKIREEEERKRKEEAERLHREEEERQRKIREEKERKLKEETERLRREEEERQRIICENFEMKNGVIVKYIGKGTKVTIPDGVTSIGDWAFEKSVSLTSIIMSNSISFIGHSAFDSCASLTRVILSDSVTSIEPGTFQRCKALTSITIPDSVTSIGWYAFFLCSKLTSVTFENTSGWYVSTKSGATSGTDIASDKLLNTSTAATYLTSTYFKYY